MSHAIKGKTLVRNTRTGQTGTFISRYFSDVTGQWVCVVQVGKFKTGWNEGEAI